MLLSPGHAIAADSDVRRTLGRLGLTEHGEDVAALQGFLERAVPEAQPPIRVFVGRIYEICPEQYKLFTHICSIFAVSRALA